MLLVIMTRSLIRLDSTVRASLNNDCMTNSHDERQREGWGGGKGMAAGLVSSAWLSPHSIPHSPLPQSLSSPHSTSI